MEQLVRACSKTRIYPGPGGPRPPPEYVPHTCRAGEGGGECGLEWGRAGGCVYVGGSRRLTRRVRALVGSCNSLK